MYVPIYTYTSLHIYIYGILHLIIIVLAKESWCLAREISPRCPRGSFEDPIRSPRGVNWTNHLFSYPNVWLSDSPRILILGIKVFLNHSSASTSYFGGVNDPWSAVFENPSRTNPSDQWHVSGVLPCGSENSVRTWGIYNAMGLHFHCSSSEVDAGRRVPLVNHD